MMYASYFLIRLDQLNKSATLIWGRERERERILLRRLSKFCVEGSLDMVSLCPGGREQLVTLADVFYKRVRPSVPFSSSVTSLEGHKRRYLNHLLYELLSLLYKLMQTFVLFIYYAELNWAFYFRVLYVLYKSYIFVKYCYIWQLVSAHIYISTVDIDIDIYRQIDR